MTIDNDKQMRDNPNAWRDASGVWHVMPPRGRYSAAKTVDEYGEARYFVEDENGDWISEPFFTKESVMAEVNMLNELGEMDEESRQSA